MACGDFNMTPSEFEEGTADWRTKLGAEIKAQVKPTCTAGNSGGRVIDFFIVDGRMGGGFGEAFTYPIAEFEEGSPHSIVGLHVRATASRDMCQQLVRPKG